MTWLRHSRSLRWLLRLLWMFCTSACAADTGDFFAPRSVHQISINVAASDLDRLRRNPRGDVPATVREADRKPVAVMLHLKGSTGSFQSVDGKPGLTLKPVAKQSATLFSGVSKLHLNNSLEDPSYLCEIIGGETFRELGIPCPRATHALITLNGKRLGLYVAVEGLSEGFLGRISNGKGALLEPAAGSDLDGRLDLKAGESQLEVVKSSQNGLSQALRIPEPDARWKMLSAFLDAKQTTQFIALEIAMAHRDGYSMARNNFRVHWDATRRQLAFLPHGMDQLFARADYPWLPEMSGAVARAMAASPEGRAAYRKALSEIVLDPQRLRRLTNRVDELTTFIKPALTRIEANALQTAAEDLKQRMTARWRFFQADLARPPLALQTFTNGLSWVSGWGPVKDTTGGVLAVKQDRFHSIRAQGETAASWRATLLLPKGRYRFECAAELRNVIPLEYGRNRGAGLRVLQHDAPAYEAMGDAASKAMTVDFEVDSPKEEVVLLCELRAKAGEVRFDGESTRLRRLD